MFYKIGHRGAAGHAPENTLTSFKKALSLGVDMIELDVHICKSQEVVVIHNKDTKKITKKKELIKNKDYSELKKLNIPKLEDALNLINQKSKINIELKGKNTALAVAEIIKKFTLKKNWKNDNFLISSFDKKSLEEISQYLPKIKRAFLISPARPYSFWIKRFPFIFKKHLQFAKKINSFSLNIHRRLINKKILNMAHNEGFKVFVYTVNSKKEIDYLKSIGVDGIFSDYPDRL
jgi:glycerophosphoryl diester phosphodiesterase